MDIEQLKYPIGKYVPQPFSEVQLREWINDIKFLPENIEHAILNLDEAQLDTPYRPEGWTVKQLIHHVADSHMNAYIRIKLSITEDKPVIKPYDQDSWAALKDSLELPIDCSLQLIESIHQRMLHVIKSVDKSMLQRSYIHPEYNREFKLDELIALYAWHGKHHAGHLTVIINS